MKVLFISYWGIQEGLSRATVVPHVKILSQFNDVKKIYLVSIEREQGIESEQLGDKINHIPIYSLSFTLSLLDKFISYIRIPRMIIELVKKYDINVIITRGSSAGAFVTPIWKSIKIPVYVESFEPHAEYMQQTGTWSRWSLRYFLQIRSEINQQLLAAGLIPVAKNYENLLKTKGINPERLRTVPCCVDKDKFKFSPNARNRIRHELKIEHNTVGIYVGKFDGLYMKKEAFILFNLLFSYFDNFFLLILTPHNLKFIRKQLIELNSSNYHVSKVSHDEVPDYLSASDFGLALYKSFPANKYLSPIKVGEYWANGLPVLLTQGVGDESSFIEKEKGGALFEISNPTPAFRKIETVLKSQDHRSRIPVLAEKYRSFERVRKVYREMIIDGSF